MENSNKNDVSNTEECPKKRKHIYDRIPLSYKQVDFIVKILIFSLVAFLIYVLIKS